MMTETLDSVDQTMIDHQELAQQGLAQTKADGVGLVGPNGLLNQLTANVGETALEVEIDEDLGYERHQVQGRDGGDSRNGRRAKTVLTEIVPVQIQVPRDTDTSFDPQIVKKRQRRWRGGQGDRVVLVGEGPHGRGDRGPCRRRVRRIGVPGHHQRHHRQGARRHGRMGPTATGPGVPQTDRLVPTYIPGTGPSPGINADSPYGNPLPAEIPTFTPPESCPAAQSVTGSSSG